MSRAGPGVIEMKFKGKPTQGADGEGERRRSKIVISSVSHDNLGGILAKKKEDKSPSPSRKGTVDNKMNVNPIADKVKPDSSPSRRGTNTETLLPSTPYPGFRDADNCGSPSRRGSITENIGAY